MLKVSGVLITNAWSVAYLLNSAHSPSHVLTASASLAVEVIVIALQTKHASITSAKILALIQEFADLMPYAKLRGILLSVFVLKGSRRFSKDVLEHHLLVMKIVTAKPVLSVTWDSASLAVLSIVNVHKVNTATGKCV